MGLPGFPLSSANVGTLGPLMGMSDRPLGPAWAEETASGFLGTKCPPQLVRLHCTRVFCDLGRQWAGAWWGHPPGQPCQLQGGGLGVDPGGPRWWTGAGPELRSVGPGLGALCLESTVDRCVRSWLWAVAPDGPMPSHLSLLRPERDTNLGSDLGSAGPGLRTLGASPGVPRDSGLPGE